MPLTGSQRRLAVAGVAVIGLGAWWLLVIGPQWRTIATVRPKVVTLHRQIRDLREGMAQLPVMKARHETLQAQLKASPKLLAQERLPVVLDELAALAKAHGIAVEMVRPVVEKAAKASKSSSKKGAAGPPPPETVSFSVEILGQAGYHEIGRLLDVVEQADSLYRVRALKIEASRKTSTRHQMAMTVEAYVAVTSL